MVLVSLLYLYKGAPQAGVVFMDDLSRAVAQFCPSASGGMAGGSAPLPSGGSSSGWTSLLASGDGGSPSGGSSPAIDQPGALELGEEPLSPTSRRVKRRLDMLRFLNKEEPVCVDHVETLVEMKRQVVDHMTHLDPHPFWVEQRETLVSDYIQTPARAEYDLQALQAKVQELEQLGGASRFFDRLRKLRVNFGIFGRFL